MSHTVVKGQSKIRMINKEVYGRKWAFLTRIEKALNREKKKRLWILQDARKLRTKELSGFISELKKIGIDV